MTALVSDYGGRREDLDNMIRKVSDFATPLLARHLNLNKPAKAIKAEWVDKVLNGLMDKLKAAVTSSTATIITLSGGTDAPKRILDGVTELLCGTEMMLVVSTITSVTNSSQHVVTRGIQSTTASTYPVNKQVKIENARAEGFSAGRDDSQKGARQYNFTVIKERQLKLSGSSIAVDVAGSENSLDQQAADLTPEIMKDLQGEFIYGQRRGTGDFSDRRAGGFQWWAVNNGANVGSQDKGNNAVNFAMFDDVIETYIKNGGDPQKIRCITSVRQQRKINALKEAKVIGNVAQSEMKINNFVNTYDFGGKANIEIEFTTDVFDDEMYFYQSDLVEVVPLEGRQWFRKPLPEDGDFKREMILGEYTFIFRNTKQTLFRFNNLDTTAA